MMIETVDELADWLADQLGIYTDRRCNEPAADWTCPEASCPDQEEGEHCHTSLDGAGPTDGDYEVIHVESCECRVNWVPAMADRIRAAAQNEATIAGLLIRR
jgi:hypothetical protein